MKDESPTAGTPESAEARVLIIGKSQYNIFQCRDFLNSKGVQAVGVFNLKDALQEVSALKPTHAFISSAMGIAKVDGVAKMLKNSLNAICYVFPEDTNRQTTLDIKASTTEHKMKINISGGGLHRIVESWMKEKRIHNQGEKKKSDKAAFTAATAATAAIVAKSSPDTHGANMNTEVIPETIPERKKPKDTKWWEKADDDASPEPSRVADTTSPEEASHKSSKTKAAKWWEKADDARSPDAPQADTASTEESPHKSNKPKAANWWEQADDPTEPVYPDEENSLDPDANGPPAAHKKSKDTPQDYDSVDVNKSQEGNEASGAVRVFGDNAGPGNTGSVSTRIEKRNAEKLSLREKFKQKKEKLQAVTSGLAAIVATDKTDSDLGPGDTEEISLEGAVETADYDLNPNFSSNGNTPKPLGEVKVFGSKKSKGVGSLKNAVDKKKITGSVGTLEDEEVITGSVETLEDEEVITGSVETLEDEEVITGSVETLEDEEVITGSVETLEDEEVITGSVETLEDEEVQTGSVKTFGDRKLKTGSVKTFGERKIKPGSVDSPRNEKIRTGSVKTFGERKIKPGSVEAPRNEKIKTGSVKTFGERKIKPGSVEAPRNEKIKTGSVKTFGDGKLKVGSVKTFGDGKLKHGSVKTLDDDEILIGSVEVLEDGEVITGSVGTLEDEAILTGSVETRDDEEIVTGSVEVRDDEDVQSGSVHLSEENETEIGSASIEAEDEIPLGDIESMAEVPPDSDNPNAEPPDTDTNLRIFKGSNVGFATVKGALFEGYVLFLTNARFPMLESQKQTLTVDLRESLRAHLEGLEKEIPENFSPQIQGLEISLDLEFLSEKLKEETEFGVHFIEGLDQPPLVDSSVETAMIAVELDRIQTEFTLDFDVYIHLDLNQKYLKYVASGGQLTTSQKQKFVKKGSRHLHIRREDQGKFQQHCVQVFIYKQLTKAA